MHPGAFQSTLVLKVTLRAVVLKPRTSIGCFSVFGGVFVAVPFYAAYWFHAPELYVAGGVASFVMLCMFGALIWEIRKGPMLVFDRVTRRLLIPRENLAFDRTSEMFLATREEDWVDHENHQPCTGDALYLCQEGPDDPAPVKLGTEYSYGAMHEHLRRIAETTGIRVETFPEPRDPG